MNNKQTRSIFKCPSHRDRVNTQYSSNKAHTSTNKINITKWLDKRQSLLWMANIGFIVALNKQSHIQKITKLDDSYKMCINNNKDHLIFRNPCLNSPNIQKITKLEDFYKD